MTQQKLSSFLTVGISDDEYQAQLQDIGDEHKQNAAIAAAAKIERQAKKSQQM